MVESWMVESCTVEYRTHRDANQAASSSRRALRGELFENSCSRISSSSSSSSLSSSLDHLHQTRRTGELFVLAAEWHGKSNALVIRPRALQCRGWNRARQRSQRVSWVWCAVLYRTAQDIQYRSSTVTLPLIKSFIPGRVLGSWIWARDMVNSGKAAHYYAF